MAPAPIMTIFFGGSFKIMASFEVITCFPSGSIPGKIRGRAPVAMIILSAITDFFCLPFVTSI